MPYWKRLAFSLGGATLILIAMLSVFLIAGRIGVEVSKGNCLDNNGRWDDRSEICYLPRRDKD